MTRTWWLYPKRGSAEMARSWEGQAGGISQENGLEVEAHTQRSCVPPEGCCYQPWQSPSLEPVNELKMRSRGSVLSFIHEGSSKQIVPHADGHCSLWRISKCKGKQTLLNQGAPRLESSREWIQNLTKRDQKKKEVCHSHYVSIYHFTKKQTLGCDLFYTNSF